jgi:thiol-disulfide isomerase/thioredoxin
MAGLIALVAALAVATALGVAIRRRSGRMRLVQESLPLTSHGDSTNTLTTTDLGTPLGERATLVQFSTEFCAYCGPARALLGEVAAAEPGVAVVEIDAAERMDLTRRLNIFATPTVFVLGPDGAIMSRASGLPKKAEVLRAVGTVRANGVVS